MVSKHEATQSKTHQDSHKLGLTRTKVADGAKAETAVAEAMTRVAVNFMANGLRLGNIVRIS